MNLKEVIQREILNTISNMVNEGRPIPMDTPNEFVYPDFKKYAYKNRKMFKKELQKSKGDSSKMFLTLSALWYKWARKNHPMFTHMKDDLRFGRALMVMMVKDDLIFSIDAFRKTNNITQLKEADSKRDYKKEYAKYGKSKKAKKYRAELNKYNRQKGTYGNGDGKDASHKGGKIVGFEDESKNRGRREKSRLKKESEAPNHNGKAAPYGSGYDKLEELKGVYEGTRCWKGYERKGFKKHPFSGKRVPNCVKRESVEEIKEGVMSDIHYLINKSKSVDDFIKTFFKEYGKQVKKSKESIEWVKGMYNDVKNEDVSADKLKDIPTKNEVSYKVAGKQVKLIKGKKSDGTDWKVKFQNGKEVSLSDVLSLIKPFPKGIKESVNEGKSHAIRDDKGRPFLLIVGEEPKDSKGKSEYKKNGFYISPQKGFKGLITAYFKDEKTLKKNIDKKYHKQLGESVNEEQLDEKLITFSNRAPYGQAVFMAGGAGSGKGFAISNFIDSAGFRVRDVDEMKKQLAALEKLKKINIDKWYKKYGKNLSDKPLKKGQTSPKAHVEEYVLGSGMTIQQIASDLKNPNNVASLHYIVDAMGLKDKWLSSMLAGKNNPETLPNLLFDITAKKVSSITQVIKPLRDAGYDSKNIHLIWVLKEYVAAVKANKTRDRVVPEDILLTTHEGASETIWTIITKGLPKGLDGRIDVILNNNEHTAFHVDDKGKKIKVEPNQQNKLDKAAPVVKGFISLPVKKQGGGILPEKVWQTKLVRWILGNAPETIDLNNPSQFKKKDEEYMI